jgi:hypothetical protein
MSISNKWVVAVFKCRPSDIKKIVEFYKFVYDLKGVRSLHFLIRDRIEDEVIFSFRVLVDQKFKEIIKRECANKLGTLLTVDKFAINPPATSNLGKYVAWTPEKRIKDFGENKFIQFIDVLKTLSGIVVEMIENNYFTSSERVELAHVMSWMLGCTEYGLLSTSGMEVGYYDRLNDKYCSYLRQNFPKAENNKMRKTEQTETTKK